MVYRFSDPGRDWDAYCDDHPDPWDHYDVEDFEESDMVSNCCDSDVNLAKNGAKICECCGKFCTLNECKSMDKFLERRAEEAADYAIDDW